MIKPRMHYKEIKAWADGAKIEILCANNSWVLSTGNPTWFLDTQHRVYDEYRELREAYESGKTIQYSDYDDDWGDIYEPIFDSEIACYRIKPTRVKKWQWVYKDLLKETVITRGFYTDLQEAIDKEIGISPYTIIQKAEWTEIEVDVEDN